jgi:hypothetical protein
MKRSTSLFETNEIKITNNICPIPQKIKNNTYSIQELLEQYKELSNSIKRIRGILYTHGIDPENLK